jgi:hypothetical protein
MSGVVVDTSAAMAILTGEPPGGERSRTWPLPMSG